MKYSIDVWFHSIFVTHVLNVLPPFILFLSVFPFLILSFSLQIVALKEIAVVHERRGADQEALKWFLQVNTIVKSIATVNVSLCKSYTRSTVGYFPLPLPSFHPLNPFTFFVIGNTVDWKDRAATAAADRT